MSIQGLAVHCGFYHKIGFAAICSYPLCKGCKRRARFAVPVSLLTKHPVKYGMRRTYDGRLKITLCSFV